MRHVLASLVGAAVLAAGLLATSAEAASVRVSVDGRQWDIGTRQGTFFTLETDLTSQPWWTGESVARSFSAAVALQLGTPNQGAAAFGPYFAFFEDRIERGQVKAMTSYLNNFLTPPAIDLLELPVRTDNDVVWAVATPVPVPAAGLMLLSALAAAALPVLRRRRA
jgi:hypothetical protein